MKTVKLVEEKLGELNDILKERFDKVAEKNERLVEHIWDRTVLAIEKEIFINTWHKVVGLIKTDTKLYAFLQNKDSIPIRNAAGGMYHSLTYVQAANILDTLLEWEN